MMPDTPAHAADDAHDEDLADEARVQALSNMVLRFLRGATLASLAASEGLDVGEVERRTRVMFNTLARTYTHANGELTAEVERMRAIIDCLRDGGFGEAAMLTVSVVEAPPTGADAPPRTLHRFIVSAPTLSEEIICEILRPEFDRIAAIFDMDVGKVELIGTGTDPEKAAEASAKTKRRALALALRTVREALDLSVGAVEGVCGIPADELAYRESGDHAMTPFVLRHHLGALTDYVRQVSAAQQDRDDALHRLKRANEQKAEADARYYELLHALLEQQGGSLIAFDLTPEARAAHVGRSIVETRLGGMNATKYVLAPREPAQTPMEGA